MSFVHHAIEWQGCGCTIKDDKGLNERTQRHPMLKPISQADISGVGIREGIELE
jgi:hypothetical protein